MIVTIPTKPYVKHFLHLNYGNPVDLTKSPELYANLRNRLQRKIARCDTRKIPQWLYSTTVDFLITDDDFYRYGWELTITDIRNFNHDIEARTKFFMRFMVSSYESIMPQKDAIRLFQDRFGFHEDIWAFGSIKKDYFRNCNSPKFKIIDIISAEIEKKSLEHLSAMGTNVTPKNS